MLVEQSSQYGIIDWQSFSIGGNVFLSAYTIDNGAAGRYVKSLALNAFVEVGEGYFHDGREADIWDLGIGVSSNFTGNVGCNMTLGIVGKETARADQGDTQFYMSCNFQY